MFFGELCFFVLFRLILPSSPLERGYRISSDSLGSLGRIGISLSFHLEKRDLYSRSSEYYQYATLSTSSTTITAFLLPILFNANPPEPWRKSAPHLATPPEVPPRPASNRRGTRKRRLYRRGTSSKEQSMAFVGTHPVSSRAKVSWVLMERSSMSRPRTRLRRIRDCRGN